MSFHFVWLLVLVVWSTFPPHCSSVWHCMCQHSELFTHQQCDMGAVNNLQFKRFDRLNLSSKIERFLSNQFESSSHSCNRHPNKAIECFYLFDWLYLIHSSCNTFHFHLTMLKYGRAAPNRKKWYLQANQIKFRIYQSKNTRISSKLFCWIISMLLFALCVFFFLWSVFNSFFIWCYIH